MTMRKNAKKAKKASAKKAKRPVVAKAAKRTKAKAAPRKVVAKKRAAKRAAPKRAAPKKKATVRTQPAARKAAAKPAIRREDHAGHLDPKYAAGLRRRGNHPAADPASFIDGPRSKDDLVEELGEEFVQQATSAEHEGEDLADQYVSEERGGPFVETGANQEFALGTDASNPKGSTREPFPRT
jgi:hypothetical protein